MKCGKINVDERKMVNFKFILSMYCGLILIIFCWTNHKYAFEHV